MLCVRACRHCTRACAYHTLPLSLSVPLLLALSLSLLFSLSPLSPYPFPSPSSLSLSACVREPRRANLHKARLEGRGARRLARALEHKVARLAAEQNVLQP
eukprot:1898651-Pleurochrysis_carterae.AAC.1